MQGLRAAGQGGQIPALPDMGHGVVKPPERFAVSRKLLVRRRAPLFEYGRHLRDRQHIGIDRSDHEIMSGGIRELRLFVSADPFVLLAPHVGQPADGRVHDARQVAFDEPRVPAGNRDLGRKREVVTNEDALPMAIAAGNDLSWEFRRPITRP